MRQTEKTTLSLPCYSKSVTTPQPIGILCMFPSEPSLQTKHLQPNHAYRPSGGDAVTVLFTPTLTFHWVLRLCCLQLWVLCDQPLPTPGSTSDLKIFLWCHVTACLFPSKMPLTVRLSICKGSEQDWLRKWCCGTFSLKSLGSRGGKHHTSFLEVTVDTVRRRVVLTDDSIMYQR